MSIKIVRSDTRPDEKVKNIINDMQKELFAGSLNPAKPEKTFEGSLFNLDNSKMVFKDKKINLFKDLISEKEIKDFFGILKKDYEEPEDESIEDLEEDLDTSRDGLRDDSEFTEFCEPCVENSHLFIINNLREEENSENEYNKITLCFSYEKARETFDELIQDIKARNKNVHYNIIDNENNFFKIEGNCFSELVAMEYFQYTIKPKIKIKL